jgi:acyl-CoA hydrolase
MLLKIYAGVESVGNTSINLYVEARSFNVYTHEEETVLSTHITFVRIDEDGNPIPISDKVKERFKK